MATLSNSGTSESNTDFGSSSASSGNDSFGIGGISGDIVIGFIHVIEAAIILVIAYFVTRYVKSKFQNMEAAHEQQRTALNLMEKLTSGFVVVIALTLALKTVGLDVSLLVSVGLLGLSYGMKDIMKNYVAGILIFFKSPFKIGDIVKIKQFTGRVEAMDLQSISMKTFDNRDVTIYNSDIMVQSVANYSRYPMRRLEIAVKLGYGSDISKAMKIFEKILMNEKAVMKSPKHSIVFKNFTDNAIAIQIKFWVQMPANINAVRSAIALQMQQAFDDAFIFMPYSRAIENENDRYAMEPAKAKIKDFYGLPLFADIVNPQAQAQNMQPAEATVEVVDSDEPTEEDMF
jgi:small-conductance mechanosensitive channel